MSKFAGIRSQSKGKPEDPQTGQKSAQTETAQSKPTAEPKAKPLAKSKDPNYTQACAYLPKSLYGSVKALVYKEGLDYSEYVERLIRKDFQERGLSED